MSDTHEALKRIYLTVDTECHNIDRLNEYILGETKKGPYGLEKILQLGQQLNVPVNVFLNIPECHRYGDEYTKRWVDLINRYGQPIFLHVHPDYIADPKRKHLWEYSEEEQMNILKTALDDYSRFCGSHQKIIFRAGAWGVNDVTYKVLHELLPEEQYEVLDLSYLYKSRWRCHLTYEEYGAANAARKFHGITLLPNTSYIDLDYLGHVIPSSLNVPSPNFGAFKKIIKKNTLHDITFTMHSWDFIKRWFFLPGYVTGDEYIIRKFKKCVKYARQNGYEFENLNNYIFVEEPDQCINLCKGFFGKLTCLWYQYRSFATIGRSFKKYAVLYFAPVVGFVIILLIVVLGCL